jgi:hypothetical protein
MKYPAWQLQHVPAVKSVEAALAKFGVCPTQQLKSVP